MCRQSSNLSSIGQRMEVMSIMPMMMISIVAIINKMIRKCLAPNVRWCSIRIFGKFYMSLLVSKIRRGLWLLSSSTSISRLDSLIRPSQDSLFLRFLLVSLWVPPDSTKHLVYSLGVYSRWLSVARFCFCLSGEMSRHNQMQLEAETVSKSIYRMFQECDVMCPDLHPHPFFSCLRV